MYSTRSNGCGGIIRSDIDDFKVTEVLSGKITDIITRGNGYTLYKLRKQNIDTFHVLNDVFRRYRIRLKALGLKDAASITEQYTYTTNKSKVPKNIMEKKYSLNKICYLKKPISKKYMIGNKFQIKIKYARSNITEFNEHNKILNFFGYQRFGAKRPVTHLIGKALLKKNFSDAIDILLSYASPYDSLENNKLRKKLSDRSSYIKLINNIPLKMDLERIVMHEIIKHNNPLKTIRALPLSIRRFFIQAYQSFIFNKTLSIAFENEEGLYVPKEGDICFDYNGVISKFSYDRLQKLAIPLVGYAYYKKTRFNIYINQILKQEEINLKDFFVKEMQEISNEGGFRNSLVTYYNYSITSNVVKFTLLRGCFATILLREVIKPEDPINSGF